MDHVNLATVCHFKRRFQSFLDLEAEAGRTALQVSRTTSGRSPGLYSDIQTQQNPSERNIQGSFQNYEENFFVIKFVLYNDRKIYIEAEEIRYSTITNSFVTNYIYIGNFVLFSNPHVS